MTEPDVPFRENGPPRGLGRYFARLHFWKSPPATPNVALETRRSAFLSSAIVQNPAVVTESTSQSAPTPYGQHGPSSRNRHVSQYSDRPATLNSRFTNRLENHRALFARYGLDFPESDWPVAGEFERIERPVRMRIRFWCHRCNTQYVAGSRECSQCNHQRCKRCNRDPPKRTTPRHRLQDHGRLSSRASTDHVIGVPVVVPARSLAGVRLDDRPGPHLTLIGEAEPVSAAARDQSTMPAPGFPPALDAGQRQNVSTNRINKRLKIRVHHICHLCERTFEPGQRTCLDCRHERCAQCPRDPPRRPRHPPNIPHTEVEPGDTLSVSISEPEDTGPPPPESGLDIHSNDPVADNAMP